MSEDMKEFLSVCEEECNHPYCWSQKEPQLDHEIQFPGRAASPYRVVYNGGSLMSICSDTDKVVVALPPDLPEGRHTYFQSKEPEAKSMQFMAYAANRHYGLQHSRNTWKTLAKEWEVLAEERRKRIIDLEAGHGVKEYNRHRSVASDVAFAQDCAGKITEEQIQEAGGTYGGWKRLALVQAKIIGNSVQKTDG